MGTNCLTNVLTMLPFDFWTYFQPLRLSGAKRLTVFENGADNPITDVTGCKLSPRKRREGKKAVKKNSLRSRERIDDDE